MILTNAITNVLTVDHTIATGSKGPNTRFLSIYNTTAKYNATANKINTLSVTSRLAYFVISLLDCPENEMFKQSEIFIPESVFKMDPINFQTNIFYLL